MGDRSSGDPGARDAPSGVTNGTLRQCQELWFTLARRKWRSVVFVPADPDGSAEALARALADVGNRVSDVPVTAITTSSLEYGSALALAELQRYVEDDKEGPPPEEKRTPLVDVKGRVVASTPADAAPEPRVDVLARAPSARLVIAIPSVVAEPIGMAAVEQADAIVILIELGRTRIADARRTVELLGRERIAGCLIVG